VPQYINPNSYDLTLVGPTGARVPVRRGRKVRLPEYFDRYVKKGFLAKVDDSPPPKTSRVVRSPKKQIKSKKSKLNTTKQDIERKKLLRTIRRNRKTTKRAAQKANFKKRPLGRPRYAGATDDYKDVISSNFYPVSDNIGVGILSYNRLKSLKRCVDSIRANTNLRRTTIFISDDNSSDQLVIRYLKQLEQNNEFVIIRNSQRLGIAGNTNRLLRCLERFKHKILLNDDVQVLHRGWETFYASAMEKTGMHHFCCRTPGVYSAKAGRPTTVKDVALNVVADKPHGAVMALDHTAFTKVGFFDENFGIYGMEHVDWSDRVVASKLQKPGYYDVTGSDKYFRIHADRSAVENRIAHLGKARSYKAKLSDGFRYVNASNDSAVPSISYIIPCRDIHRSKAIVTVINNVRAQRYPAIEIIIAEQDWVSRLKGNGSGPHKMILAKAAEGTQFNKSKAFNAGVDEATHDLLVLHDADMLVLADYTRAVHKHMRGHESCFLGGKVYYANKKTSDLLSKSGVVNSDIQCEKSVEYFEGGTIGVKKSAYWKIGGFNEDFWGYGCEDTDFYAGLSGGTKFNETRHQPLLHVWHPRTQGWGECHEKNKILEGELKELSIGERIKKQIRQLKKTKYARNL
jgi:GT2 family glycosyltransferase